MHSKRCLEFIIMFQNKTMKKQAGRPTAYSCPVTLSFFRTNEKLEMKCLSLVVFEIFAKIAFWPLNLGPRSKVMAPNESPYMVSYMSTIEMKSLSLVVFEIFAKIAFWPLDLGPRSKVMAPSESPYMVSYMTVIKMESLTLVVREIFEKK